MTVVRKTAIQVAVVGFILCSARARSSEVLAPLTKKVFYGDLNLDLSSGVKTLYARLQQAAENACSPLESRDPDRHNLWRTCYADALESAVIQINNRLVTALHRQTIDQAKPTAAP